MPTEETDSEQLPNYALKQLPELAILYEVMSDVTVYTTDPCSFCTRVKGLLKSRGVEFAEVNLSKDPEGRVELAQKTGMMTFPQVLVGGELVGGFTEVQSAAESGRLDELLIEDQPAA
jgi:glutaredoxin 3